MLEAVWRAVAFVAVPAAALSVWAWARGGARLPSGAGLWDALARTGRAVAPYRVPVALALGVGVPAALVFYAVGQAEPDGVSLVVPLAAAVVITAALYVFPAALVSLTALPLRARWAVAGAVGAAWLAFVVFVGFGVGTNQSATVLNDAVLAWVTSMALPVLASVPFYVGRAVRWVRDGFDRPRAV